MAANAETRVSLDEVTKIISRSFDKWEGIAEDAAQRAAHYEAGSLLEDVRRELEADIQSLRAAPAS